MIDRRSTVLTLSLLVGICALNETAYSGIPARPQALFPQLSPTKVSVPLSGCWGSGACQLFLYELNASGSPQHGLTAAILRVSQPARVRVVDVRKSASKKELLARSADGGTLAIVNGGFFGFDKSGSHLALGLMIVDGRRLRPLHPWSTGGVLVQTSSGPRIHRIRDFKAGAYPYALQSKPLLVENGAVAIGSDDGQWFDRSAVGLLKDGAIAFAGAFTDSGQSISLKQFADLLVDWASSRDDQWDSVLAMDGGPGAHLFIPSLKMHFGADVTQFIPNVIALEAP